MSLDFINPKEEGKILDIQLGREVRKERFLLLFLRGLSKLSSRKLPSRTAEIAPSPNQSQHGSVNSDSHEASAGQTGESTTVPSQEESHI